jgi:hypothetical protein
MLDPTVHQGIGLHRFAAQSSPRVLALVAHGDDASEGLLAHQLCAHLAAQGYATALVDATLEESEQQPGLSQLMEDTCWRSQPAAAPWTVLPAKRGLRRLCHHAQGDEPPVLQLGQHLNNYAAIAVYAPAQALSSLLAGSEIQPLLTADATPASLVSAYHALKHLLLIGKLQPTIVSMVSESVPGAAALHSAVGRSLQDCAMTFLGCRLDSVQLQLGENGDELEPLALRLLENGLPRPHAPLAAMPWMRQGHTTEKRLAGGH